jgi:hypothetical protein
MTMTDAEAGKRMTGLNIFGLFAVSVMVICYALEGRNQLFILAFAASCVLASTYGFLQGAWPFGMVEALWSVIAVKRWWSASRMHGSAAAREAAGISGSKS